MIQTPRFSDVAHQSLEIGPSYYNVLLTTVRTCSKLRFWGPQSGGKRDKVNEIKKLIRKANRTEQNRRPPTFPSPKAHLTQL